MRKQLMNVESRYWRPFKTVVWSALLTIAVAGCAASNPPKMSGAHLKPIAPRDKHIPQATQLPVLPPPKAAPKQETYTVVVNDVPVKELLFSVARDAKLNVDIHPGISGNVTLNAVNQTLPQILARIAKQVDLRYELDGPNLSVSPDFPYWRLYHVDYVNMSRESTSEVSVATQVATTGGSVAGGSSGSNGNKSNTTVKNVSNNHFWDLLISNIQNILGDNQQDESAQDTPAASATPAPATSATASAAAATVTASSEAAPMAAPATAVVANPVAGVINVLATQRQHEQVQAFLDQVMVNARRQVLIEMTIVEVELSDSYQAGVDWSRLQSVNGAGPNIVSSMLGTNLSTPPVFSLGYENASSSVGNISAMIKMLETFGHVKVLSSPKIMALNNQTALLKVVDESVYFTVTQETTQTEGQPSLTTFTSAVHTVPVGLVMSVMPQINENDQVTLNVRPTISRITSFKEDPVPKLMKIDFENLVPQIQVREMESLIQVSNGQTIVMGGLMQNKVQKDRNSVPGLSDVPIAGDLFSYRNQQMVKTELVLFLRPTIIRNGGIDMDLSQYNRFLPEAESRAPSSAPPAPRPAATVREQAGKNNEEDF